MSFGAECGTRTHTAFRTTVFETVASASSANPAHRKGTMAGAGRIAERREGRIGRRGLCAGYMRCGGRATVVFRSLDTYRAVGGRMSVSPRRGGGRDRHRDTRGVEV